jgi:hypothetical protein
MEVLQRVAPHEEKEGYDCETQWLVKVVRSFDNCMVAFGSDTDGFSPGD